MAFRNIPPNGFPAIPDIEDLEAVVKDVGTLKTTTAALAEDVGDLEDQKANQITIALPFNPETEYEVGDLVYYNGLSYRCTNAHTGEWDADDFAGTTIANELASLKSGLTSVETLQTITPDALLNGDITIKRTCGAKFVLCHNMILKNDLAAGATVELCAAGTVLNPPTEDTVFQIYAKSGGNDIAPVNLVLKADGSIIVINFASVSTKLYGYCCGAYI